MRVEVGEEPLAALARYARVPIAFEVRRVLDVAARGAPAGGFALSERALDVPYWKDYDAIEGEGPESWAKRFDVSNWGVFAARSGGRRVGGAVVAYDTADFFMLEGRRDLAVLWDIRVSPDSRGRGVGSALFRAAEAWSSAKGCRLLKIETQNINAPACEFYAARGCVLGGLNLFAYPELPGEVQLLWYKELARAAPGDFSAA